MIEKAKAAEILQMEGNSIARFDEVTRARNDFSGWISKSHGFHMGSLVIDTVNEEETLQVVQGMPKLQYLNKHSDEINDPSIFEKYDGTNIVMFPLLQDDECIEVLCKTRNTPRVQNKFYQRMELALMPQMAEAVKNEKLSFAYELYGTGNPHTIQYHKLGVDMELRLLTVLDQHVSLPAENMELMAIKYEIPTAKRLFIPIYVDDLYVLQPTTYFLEKYCNWFDQEPIYAPTLWDAYFKLESVFEKMNMVFQKEFGGSIVEGAVWHYTNAMGENCMLKNKATSIKESHQSAARGIPGEIIRKALYKMDENVVDAESQYKFNKLPLIRFIEVELLEEYPVEVVQSGMGLNKIRSEMAKFFRKEEIPTDLIDVAKMIVEDNPETESPQDLMRLFAIEYPDLRSKSKKMFQAFERLNRAKARAEAK